MRYVPPLESFVKISVPIPYLGEKAQSQCVMWHKFVGSPLEKRACVVMAVGRMVGDNQHMSILTIALGIVLGVIILVSLPYIIGGIIAGVVLAVAYTGCAFYYVVMGIAYGLQYIILGFQWCAIRVWRAVRAVMSSRGLRL